MLRFTLPWSVLAQANHRLMPVAQKVNGKWVGRMIPATEYTEKKTAFELKAVQQFRQQSRQQAPAFPKGTAVAVNMVFYEPDLRRRDPSNLQKMIEDALSEIAYEDDTQIHDCHWMRAGLD